MMRPYSARHNIKINNSPLTKWLRRSTLQLIQKFEASQLPHGGIYGQERAYARCQVHPVFDQRRDNPAAELYPDERGLSLELLGVLSDGAYTVSPMEFHAQPQGDFPLGQQCSGSRCSRSRPITSCSHRCPPGAGTGSPVLAGTSMPCLSFPCC